MKRSSPGRLIKMNMTQSFVVTSMYRYIKSMFGGEVTYMNSGDWVENLTALEYQHQQWKIYSYDPADFPPISKRLQVPIRKRPEPKRPRRGPKGMKKPKEKRMPGSISM